LVENCVFDQSDDAVVIKAGRNRDAWRLSTPAENILYSTQIDDIRVQRRFFRQEIVGDESGNHVCDEVHKAAMAGVLNLTYIFEFVINGIY
jgi:polygalacturonase